MQHRRGHLLRTLKSIPSLLWFNRFFNIYGWIWRSASYTAMATEEDRFNERT